MIIMRQRFTSGEKKSVFGMSLVLSSRMLGLFLLLPVFSIYVHEMKGATTLLTGITFGAYSLTQMLFQVPFGLLSDKLGRKFVIILGLTIFAVGSIIAAITTNIYILMAARFLQGSGAIASACMAWIADSTNENIRNTAMGFMGMSIGLSITLGMIVGPIVGGTWSVQYIFWICLFLSLINILYVSLFLKNPFPISQLRQINPAFNHWSDVLKQNGLWKLDISGFLKNVCMSAIFFAIPLLLKKHYQMTHMWKIYLPITLIGTVIMMGSSRLADKGYVKHFFIAGFVLIMIAAILIGCSEDNLQRLIYGFFIYYAGQSLLEPIFPSTVSKLAPAHYTGTTFGVFNMSQYLGIFCGSMVAGTIVSAAGFPHLFFLLSITALLGLIAITFVKMTR